MRELFFIIGEQLGTAIVRHTPLSGGDISRVFLLETTDHRYVLKTNRGLTAEEMFAKEALALATISETDTINVPAVHSVGREAEASFILMDFIESKRPSEKDFERFGGELAQLHAGTFANFGWGEDNYLGSLLQSNKEHADWPEFYAQERLLPQLHLAVQRGLLSTEEVPNVEALMVCSREVLPAISPVLLHGDLWSGNFLIASDGTPFIIDPAVYYGHGEVDLAMSRLFGGFDGIFYEAYHAVHPAKEGMERRQDWYQLYYLLAHLNLFGASYYDSVKKILVRYF